MGTVPTPYNGHSSRYETSETPFLKHQTSVAEYLAWITLKSTAHRFSSMGNTMGTVPIPYDELPSRCETSETSILKHQISIAEYSAWITLKLAVHGFSSMGNTMRTVWILYYGHPSRYETSEPPFLKHQTSIGKYLAWITLKLTVNRFSSTVDTVSIAYKVKINLTF